MKNFRLNIFIRVAVITGLAIALAWVLFGRPSLFIPATILVLLVVAIVNLITYIEKSNRDLTHFLLSIRQGAFTETFTSGQRGKKFSELSGALNDIVTEFAKINQEKELHHQFLEALNENIGVGIFTFDNAGKVLTINPAAKKLIDLPSFSKLDDFKKVNPTLFEKIVSIKPEQKLVVAIPINNSLQQLGIQLKEIVLQQRLVRIFLIQNLNNELEAKEIDAWQQLIRVLTHEIMNSVTPITSLSEAARKILSDDQNKAKAKSQLSEENIEDVYSSIQTIESRSRGLTRFVTAYKTYSKPLEVKIDSVDLALLTRNVITLISEELAKKRIAIITDIPDKLDIKLDKILIEQVVLNLIKNAMEAVDHDGTGRITILLEAKGSDGAVLKISDNGSGIDEETAKNIFIPFFTTKSSGSGIGLSFSKQVIKLHGGSIDLTSTPGVGTSFRVEL